MARLIVLLLLCLTAALARAEGGGYWRVATGPDGNALRVYVMPRTACPFPDAPACAVPVIFGTEGDPEQLRHELDHWAGLEHGHWTNHCAPILRAGHTRWTPGKLLCRRQGMGGDYYEIDP